MTQVKYFYQDVFVHGSAGHFVTEVNLSDGVSGYERDERNLVPLGSSLMYKSRDGMRIWNIVPGNFYEFSVHYPLVLPTKVRAGQSETQLYLNKIHLDFRILSDEWASPNNSVQVSAYNGNQHIVSFGSGNGEQGNKTFALDEAQPIGAAGLLLVLRLGVPLGLSSSFEFRSVGVSLVTVRNVPGAVGTGGEFIDDHVLDLELGSFDGD